MYVIVGHHGEKNSIIAVDDGTPEEDVKPLDDETVNKVKKKIEKIKMNRDIEHIQLKSA